jgi:hypothetical protein
MVLFLLLVVAAVVLGLIGALVKGLLYLLVIGVIVFLVAMLFMGARLRRGGRTAGR